MNNRYELLDLMRTMANGLVAVEVVADHLAELDADGQSDAAEVLRMLGRNHRVRSLELQGQLAAANEVYADLFQGTDGMP